MITPFIIVKKRHLKIKVTSEKTENTIEGTLMCKGRGSSKMIKDCLTECKE